MKLLRVQQLRLLLLLLHPLLILLTYAQDFHQSISITGCSDPKEIPDPDADQEDMFGLEGEVYAYADFHEDKAVYPQPEFVDHTTFPGTYYDAVANQQTCRYNLRQLLKRKKFPLPLDPPGTPLLFPKELLRPSQPNTLVCQASGFYPAPVVFSWTRDGLSISSSSVSQAYPQSDGSFSQLSTLHILPQDGQVYSCSLEHPALRDQRKTRLWTVEFERPSLAPSVFCAVGLTVGLVGVAVGTFFLVKGINSR